MAYVLTGSNTTCSLATHFLTSDLLVNSLLTLSLSRVCSHAGKEQALVLDQYIDGFRKYAEHREVVSAFDLMCWAICCGATDLAQIMWVKTDSPIRASLVAKKFCARIIKQRDSDTCEELVVLMGWFGTKACDLLEQLSDKEIARKLLLSAESTNTSDDLGTKFKHGGSNLLELAVELEDVQFISHRYCQAVVEEMWNGRSPSCGRIRLKSQPEWWKFLLQLILPFVRILDTTYNDLYPWPQAAGTTEGWSMSSRDTDTAGRGDVLVSVTWLQHIWSLIFIPSVKRVLQSISNIIFLFVFVVVAFQPLCEPMNAWHYALCAWVGTKFVHSMVGLAMARRFWWLNIYKRFEMIAVVLLSIYFIIALHPRPPEGSVQQVRSTSPPLGVETFLIGSIRTETALCGCGSQWVIKVTPLSRTR